MAGQSANVTVTVTRTGGFAGDVALSVSGLPAGVTADGATVAGGASSTALSIAAGASAAAGTSTVTVTASGSGVANATATFSLVVSAAPVGGFTLSLDPSSLTVSQGGSAQTTVTISRTAPFAGAVALAASGLPAGVTASFDPASATAGTSVLTLSASASAATGTHTITVRGTGTGVAEQTATMSLVVNEVTTGGDITWPICPGVAVPIWFAVQDGDGPWTRVNQVANGFSFSLSTGRAGIAYVTQTPDGSYTLSVLYFTAEEVGAQGTGLCNEQGSKTVTGSVAGLSGTQQASIALGGQSATVVPGGPTSFTVSNVRDGPVDLLASRSTLVIDGTSISQVVDRVIMRRGLTPANGSELPVLDFGSAEAFAPALSDLTIENLAGDGATTATWYQTANGFVNTFFTSGGPGTASVQEWAGIPADRQEAGDLHALQVTAFPVSTTSDRLRLVLNYFQTAGDRTLTLGPDLTMPTLSTVTTAPYVRFRAQLPVQPEYDRSWGIGWIQIASGGNARTVAMTATAGYFGNPSTLDIAIPDFTGVDGWSDTWGPRAGVPTQYSVGGTGWTGTGGVVSGPVVDGGIVRGGFRMGTITP